jgi:hypothetical protein
MWNIYRTSAMRGKNGVKNVPPLGREGENMLYLVLQTTGQAPFRESGIMD